MDTIAIAALPQEERTMAQPIPPLPPKLDDNMVPNCKVKGQPKPIGKKTFNALTFMTFPTVQCYVSTLLAVLAFLGNPKVAF